MRFFETAASRAATIVAAAKAQDTSDAAVVATDMRGSIVYWNEHATALYGWPADETVGRKIGDVIPTTDGTDDSAQIMDQLRHGNSWRGQFNVTARDGTPVVAFLVDTPVRSGLRVIGVVGVSRRERRRKSRGTGDAPAGI